MRGVRPGKDSKYCRADCRCWNCRRCGPRRADFYRSRILQAVTRHRLTRLLTLTLDPKKIMSESEAEIFYRHFELGKDQQVPCTCATCVEIQIRSISCIRQCWAKLRVYFGRKHNVSPKFIAVLEFQKNTGLAHLHIVIDRYVPWRWAQNAWCAVGGGEHVHIKHIDAHRAAAYLSKYLSKELFLSAPEGTRRVTTSRSIRLNEKEPSEYQWELIRANIERLFEMFKRRAETPLRDSEGELVTFVVRE